MRPTATAAVSRAMARTVDPVLADDMWGVSPTCSAICEMRSEW